MKQRSPKKLRAAMEAQKKELTKKRVELMNMVSQTLDSLKINSTVEEKSLLDIANFEPNSPYNCILGQLTGYCESARARNLLPRNKSKLSWFEIYLQHCGQKAHEKIFDYLRGKIESIQLPFVDLIMSDCKYILN